MNKIFRWIIGILCVLGLVAVRFFEDYLFFDPLQQFYHGLYLNATTAPDFGLSFCFRDALFILVIWNQLGFALGTILHHCPGFATR